MSDLQEKPNNENYYAEGQHKKVRYDEKKNRIVAEFKEPGFKLTTHQVKGSYYLRKILHLIMPQNIPDINLSATKPPRMEAEFVTLDQRHLELQQLRNRAFKNTTHTRSEVYRSQEISQEIDKDPKVVSLKDKLSEVLGFYDYGSANFAFNVKTGNAVYIENDIIPWYLDHYGNITRVYREDAIRKHIDALKSEEEKSKALSYLSRIKILEEQERGSSRDNYLNIS